MISAMRRLLAVLAIALVVGCGGPTPAPAFSPALPPNRPTILINRLDPPVGTDVDTGTVLEAGLWYSVPRERFEPGRYAISLVFLSDLGYAFNRAPGGAVVLREPAGVVNMRYPLSQILDDAHLARPVTAYFYLRRLSAPFDSVPRKYLAQGAVGSGPVIAGTEPIFFGGNEPADSSWMSLHRLASIIDTYGNRRPRRALALARDSTGRYAYGLGFGYRTTKEAVERALTECEGAREERRVAGPCEILAVDSRLVGPAASGQERREQPVEGPEAVARAYFDALEQERWADAAGLVDPAFVAAFHQDQIRVFSDRSPSALSAEQMAAQLREHDPEMPLEVAEYQARKMLEVSEDQESFIAYRFARVESVEQLLALTPFELMARHLEAEDPRFQYRIGIERARERLPPQAAAAIEDHMPSVGWTILGSIVESDSLVHVVYRPIMPHRGPAAVEAASLKLTAEGWRLRSSVDSFHNSAWGFSILEMDAIPQER